MQKIKIFLASSNELAEDRLKFANFISEKNTLWDKEGKPQILLQIWEYESEALSVTRSQDEYNKVIADVDIFVMLFWTKVGKYTHEEFNWAKQLFHNTGKPRVLAYQKAAPPEKQEQSLKDFTASLLQKDKEYFWGSYEHFDSLALKITKELDRFCFQQHITAGFQKVDLQSEVNAILDEATRQRKQDLSKRLTQLQTLLARYQDTLDFEENPKLQMKYEKEVSNTQQMIEKVLAEIKTL
jgi:hypothetical protein